MENINAIEGNEPIELVQGDTFTYTIEFADSGIVEFLERLVFTCERYGIEKDFERVQQENGVVFQVRLEDTDKMCPSITTFDITAYFVEGEKETVVSETGIKFRVFEKKNPVGVGDGDGV